MKLRAGCDIQVEAAEDCPSVAMLRPRSGQAQWLSCESYLFEPWVRTTEYVDTFGNLCQRMVIPKGRMHIRVEAEVDEYDAPRVAVGAEATLTAEGYGAASWRGTVEEVPDRVGGRSIAPEDPGRPTDTRVLLVKVRFDVPHPLKLGQRVEVEIRTALKADPR